MLQINELLCYFYLTKKSTKVKLNVIKFIPSNFNCRFFTRLYINILPIPLHVT